MHPASTSEMPDPLTERQRTILGAIVSYVDANAEAPTYRELADLVGERSLNGLTQHLHRLERKGWIRIRTRARGLVICSRPSQTSA